MLTQLAGFVMKLIYHFKEKKKKKDVKYIKKYDNRDNSHRSSSSSFYYDSVSTNSYDTQINL